MGGNYSYNKTLDRVRGKRKTHHEFHDRIDGHKILLQNRNDKQVKLPVNSNSESPIYLGARKTGDDSVKVTTIGIYKNHVCIGQIDLEFDKNGNFVPYDKDKSGTSHFHLFTQDPKTGLASRKSHSKSNRYPIDSKYNKLIQKIVEYNKKHNS